MQAVAGGADRAPRLDRPLLWLPWPKYSGIVSVSSKPGRNIFIKSRRPVVGQHKMLKTLWNFANLCVQEQSWDWRIEKIENDVLQATIKHEVEVLTIVDVSTFVINKRFLVVDRTLSHGRPLISLIEVIKSSEILVASSFLSPEKMQILWKLLKPL